MYVCMYVCMYACLSIITLHTKFPSKQHWLSRLGEKRLYCVFCEVRMNCSIGHYLHDVQASLHIIHASFLIKCHGSEFHDTDGTFCWQQMAWPFGDSPHTSGRQRLVKWRVVAQKQRSFVGWEMKEGEIMINEREITNLMIDTKRNRWWLLWMKRW